jgi:MFS family permease
MREIATSHAKKAAWSAFATLVGIGTGIIVMLLFGWPDWRICAFMISLFAVPVWLLVLLPISVRLPPSSPLWRPATSTALGAGAGALMIILALGIWGGLQLALIFAPVGAIVGGVTCLVGSTITRHVDRTRKA